MERPSNIVAEIVVTGGPCGGKSSCMAFLSEQLSELGFRVFIVPEIATMFITGGVSDLVALASSNRERYLDVQRNLVLAQSELRQRFQQLAGAFAD